MHADEFYLLFIVREQEISEDVYLDRGRTGRDWRYDLSPRNIRMVDPLGTSSVKTVQKRKGPQNSRNSPRSEVKGKEDSKKGVKLRSKKICDLLFEVSSGWGIHLYMF